MSYIKSAGAERWQDSRMPLVLVTGDDTARTDAIKVDLAGAGFEVHPVPAVDAPSQAAGLFVLVDGRGHRALETCVFLREDERTRHVPVVIVSAHNDETDRIAGFLSGADDYIALPYCVPEFVLRLRALLRRSDSEGRHRASPITIDVGSHRAWADEHELKLTTLEFALLRCLNDRTGQALTRDELVAFVGNERGGRTIDNHIMRLRVKLGARGELLQTVRGLGYRLVSVAA